MIDSFSRESNPCQLLVWGSWVFPMFSEQKLVWSSWNLEEDKGRQEEAAVSHFLLSLCLKCCWTPLYFYSFLCGCFSSCCCKRLSTLISEETGLVTDEWHKNVTRTFCCHWFVTNNLHLVKEAHDWLNWQNHVTYFISMLKLFMFWTVLSDVKPEHKGNHTHTHTQHTPIRKWHIPGFSRKVFALNDAHPQLWTRPQLQPLPASCVGLCSLCVSENP